MFNHSFVALLSVTNIRNGEDGVFPTGFSDAKVVG